MAFKTLLLLIAVCFTEFSLSALAYEERQISFFTADKVKEQASLYQAKDAKGIVLLLPMLGRNRQDWQPLIQPLVDKGFSIVSVDLRGQGQSTSNAAGSSIDYRKFQDSDWQKLPDDVAQIIKELAPYIEKPDSPVLIVGASIGANTAALVAASVPQVKSVVLLSPGLDYHGLKPAGAIKAFKGPTLIVASKDDSYSFSSSRDFADSAPGRIDRKSFEKSGHGTQMFARQPKLAEQIADWLFRTSTKK